MIKANEGEIEIIGNIDNAIGEMLCTVSKVLEFLIVNEDYEVLDKVVLPELKKFSKCRNIESLYKILEG